ncbi:MAG: hypothetical protein LZ169_04990 [Thaumarchaeota archaeon]|jgi:hypothetical protein|nr:hypothetical protein [Candidatus Wolframiiraptor allenii]
MSTAWRWLWPQDKPRAIQATTMKKVFNTDLIAAHNILMAATSNNTSMTPITPEPLRGVGVMAGDPAKG